MLAAGADVIHFDVMDNHYVPSLTIGPLVCAALRKRGIKAPIDVHLMVRPVDELARAFAGAGASWISFHPEASQHVDRTINLIRELGCSPGPGAESGDAPRLPGLHAAEPGPRAGDVGEPRLRWAGLHSRQPAEAQGHARAHQQGWAGGSCSRSTGASSPTTSAQAAEAGADVFVAGSAIFGSRDYAATIRPMRAELQGLSR